MARGAQRRLEKGQAIQRRAETKLVDGLASAHTDKVGPHTLIIGVPTHAGHAPLRDVSVRAAPVAVAGSTQTGRPEYGGSGV